MKLLLEADLSNYAVDIKALFAGSKDDESKKDGQAQEAEKTSKEKDFSIVNRTPKEWEAEYKRRIDANNALGPGARESETEIDKKFFKEFYLSFTGGDKELTTNLILLGDLLKKAIKAYGYSPKVNPILGFLKLKYVRDNLLKTKLLNINNFVVIVQATTKHLVADSEFFRTNDYNIIYCRDFYKKTKSEMTNYLKVQSSILGVNKEKYSYETQVRNKKAFFYVARIKEKNKEKRAKLIKDIQGDATLSSALNQKTVLNDLELASIISNVSLHYSDTSSASNTHMSSSTMKELVDNLPIRRESDRFAALQFISIYTGSPSATIALKQDRFSGVTVNDLSKAMADILPIMQKYMKHGKYSENDISTLVALILNKDKKEANK